jgi:hypothetical protein
MCMIYQFIHMLYERLFIAILWCVCLYAFTMFMCTWMTGVYSANLCLSATALWKGWCHTFLLQVLSVMLCLCVFPVNRSSGGQWKYEDPMWIYPMTWKVKDPVCLSCLHDKSVTGIGLNVSIVVILWMRLNVDNCLSVIVSSVNVSRCVECDLICPYYALQMCTGVSYSR